MGAAAIAAVGINVSTQGRVHGWMTQELKASGGADADAHRYQGSSLENEGTWWIRARGRIGVMLRAAQSMINPGQFVLELAALALSRSLAGRQHRTFVIRFAALAAAANCAFLFR